METNLRVENSVIPIEFIKLMVVGASGTIIDYLILAFLIQSGWRTFTASVFSYSIGIMNNFLWNNHWTFKEYQSNQKLEKFYKFVINCLVGLGTNAVIVLVLSQKLAGSTGLAGFHLLFAKAIATVVVVVWNFIANKFWNYNIGKN